MYPAGHDLHSRRAILESIPHLADQQRLAKLLAQSVVGERMVILCVIYTGDDGQ